MITQLYLASAYGGTYPTVPGGDFAMLSFDGRYWQNLHPTSAEVGSQTNGIRDSDRFSYSYSGVEKWYRAYSDGNGSTPTIYLDVATDVTLLNWSRVVTLTVATSGADNYQDNINAIFDSNGFHLTWTNDATRAFSEIHPNSADPSTWGSQANWSSITVATDYASTQLNQGDTFVLVFGTSSYGMVYQDNSGGYHTRTSSYLMSGWSAPTTPTVDSALTPGEPCRPLLLPDGTIQMTVSNGNTHNYKIWTFNLATLTSAWASPQPLSIIGYDPSVAFNWIMPNAMITDPDQIKQFLYMLSQNNAPWLPKDVSGSNITFSANWGFIRNDYGWVTVQCGPAYPSGLSGDNNNAKLSLPFPNPSYEYPVGTVMSAAGVPITVMVLAGSDYLGFFNEEAETWIENHQLNAQGTSLTFTYKAY